MLQNHEIHEVSGYSYSNFGKHMQGTHKHHLELQDVYTDMMQ